jgi:TonB-dependent starch-binding outer membrane protein SusC
MKKILLMSLMLMFTFLTGVLAQTRTISGRITDRSTGSGLPGVTILLKGTTNGVSSNADGGFTLSVPATGGTIVFSSVGMITQERPIGTESEMAIALATDSKQLTEVVVTGYGGSQDVKDITGSVATVKADKFQSQPVQSFDQALNGRAAGVMITSGGGALADQTSIRIRGVNSISNSSQPLIVVDGVPISQRENNNVFNGGNGTRYNPLADINPNDIESVEVLKDASAAAIYGSRAANGVLIINTKRGRSGQNRVSFNSYLGIQNAVRLPRLLNGDDFNVINNEKAFYAREGSSINGGSAGNGVGNLSIPAIGIAGNVDVNNDGQPDRTDWLKEVFRQGNLQNYQLSLSGGTDKATYYASGDWTDQKGIIVNNRLRRGTFRLNIDVTPKTWLKAGLSTSYSKALNNGVLTDTYLAGATVSGYNAPPNVPIYNPDGTYYLNPAGNLGNGANNISYVASNYNHPAAVLALQRNDNTSQRILTNGYLTAIPFKGFSLTTRYGIDYTQNFEDQYSDPTISGLGRAYGQGLVQDNELRRNQFNWQNYANYNRTFAEKHTIGLTAGVEFQEFQEKQIYTPAGDFADPKYKEILDGLFAAQLAGGGTKFGQGFQSYYGSANYSFENRYYASFSARYDGSSVFGANSRYGFFPGGSLGWRISEESFLKDLNTANHLTDLKLRVSYGLVGNANGIPSYGSRTLIGAGQYADINGFSNTQLGNPNLKWESSRKLDFGIDASFFNSRVGLVVDYFDNQISNLVLTAPVLRTAGVPNGGSGISSNVGAMNNKGVEVTLNTTNFEAANGFKWTSSINASWIKNEITALASPSDIISGFQRASVGRTLSVYDLPEWAGVNPANGNAMFYAADGSIKQYDAAYTAITNGTQGRWLTMGGDVTSAIGTDDYKYQKKGGIPTWFGGFDNTFSFKGIELGVFMQYSGGNLILNQTRQGLMTTSLNNNIEEIKDRWTTPGQVTNVQKLVLRDAISTQGSTRWLENGNFLRFRQLSLGYNLPSTLTSRFGLNNLRIYALAQNLYTFTKYSGNDPEVNTSRSFSGSGANTSNVAYGLDNRGVPQPRSYTFGINIGI